MTELLTVLLPLLLVDVLNPVLFAAMLFATGSARPVLNSSAMLAGHTSAYFAAGIGIALGLETITDRLSNPEPVDYLVGLLVGLVCLYAAVSSRGGGASEPKEPQPELTAWSSFSFGAIINFVGVPFAVPYFAAIDQILRVGLPLQESTVALLAYNLAYAAPFALVPILVAAVGDGCRPLLEKINSFLIRITDAILPLMLGLLGLALIADALLFFVRGEGLY